MGETPFHEKHVKLNAALVGFERRVKKGVDLLITPQIDYVSRKTMGLYDTVTRSMLKGDAQRAALRARPTMQRVAKGMGVSLVVAEGVALAVGAKKGTDWITKKYIHKKHPVIAGHTTGANTPSLLAADVLPVTRLSSRARVPLQEVRLSPELEAHKILVDEIRALQETGTVSERLERILFMVGRNSFTNLEAAGDFERSAKASLEHLCTPDGKEAVRLVKEALANNENPWWVKDYFDQLIHHVGGQEPEIDHVALNWWTFAFRGIGIREFLGIPPQQRIAGLDYDHQYTIPPYLEYVRMIVGRVMPSSTDWVWQGSST